MSDDKGWQFLNPDDLDSFDGSDSSSYEYPDGSRNLFGADGSYGFIDTDGSGYYYGADGSFGSKDADGSGYYYGVDGSFGTMDADGSKFYCGAIDSHNSDKDSDLDDGDDVDYIEILIDLIARAIRKRRKK